MREVTVNVDEPAPADIELVVEVLTASTATEGMNGDYTIDSKSLTINAGESSGTITVRSVNDDVGEGDKTIMLGIKLAGGTSLPDGWTLGTAMHTVTLKDDDRSIHFVTGASNTPSEVEEPARPSNANTNKSVPIVVGITHAPTANIMVRVEAAGFGNKGQTARSSSSLTSEDYIFAGATLTFPTNMITTQTASLTLINTGERDLDETIVLTLTGVGISLADEGQGFVLGDPHIITIPANDRSVGFELSESSFTEGVGATGVVTVNVTPPAPADITLTVTPTGTATKDTDYTISTESLTIDAGESSDTITITSMDDNTPEGDETIILEISLPQGSSLPDGWNFSQHSLNYSQNITIAARAQADSNISGQRS